MKIFNPKAYTLNASFLSASFLCTLLLSMPELATAAESIKDTAVKSSVLANEQMSSGYIAQLIIGLLIVLLCIIALAWLAKKMNRFQTVAEGSLKVIGGISMGSRERVVLLQVGDEQLLLGVSPGRINKLHTLNNPVVLNDTTSATGNHSGNAFLDKFKSVMADAASNKTSGNEHQK